MKLIVGLGNPGKKYQNNRHNVGYMVSDKFRKGLAPVKIVKSSVFMNSSGEEVRELVDKYKIDLNNLLIIHDELDLPLGEYKLQKGRGAAGHNGVKSVMDSLGTNEFWRLRVGIHPRGEKIPHLGGVSGEEYVLSNFTKEERKVIEDLISSKLIPEIEKWTKSQRKR